MDSTETASDIIWVDDLEDHAAGGKALGLKRLIRSGVNVPRAFVILGTSAHPLRDSLSSFLEAVGSDEFAVRSSSAEEDGTESSFAGQFDTYLHVRGIHDIIDAVGKCRASTDSFRVRKYSGSDHSGPPMPVIIQALVNAEFSGVCFTADPVSGRRDRVIINSVSGLGEKLVSGYVSGEEYVFSKKGQLVSRRSGSDDRRIPAELLDRIFSEAVYIEKKNGFPVDLEWAINREGCLYWLQLRPITTLDDVHLNELDSPLDDRTHIYTRCNIGEMMPGPVTPLTWSVFARGIDVGMQDFMTRIGVQDKIYGDNRYIFIFYNHLFISLTSVYELPGKVLFTRKENIDHGICGYVLPDDGSHRPRAGFFTRTVNICRYLMYIKSAGRRLEALRGLERDFHIERVPGIDDFYRSIADAREMVFQAWAHHYTTSSRSGALNTTVLQIMERTSRVGQSERLHDLAVMLKNIEGIDGADVMVSLENIIREVQENRTFSESIINRGDDEALGWLTGPDSGEAGELFRHFLREHGHRCVREAELREREWAADPLPLIALIRMNIAARRNGSAKEERNSDARSSINLVKYGFFPSIIIKILLSSVRKSVAARENSKSLCIKMQNTIKKAYEDLGNMLVNEGLLDDADQVFFLTHDELGLLLNDKSRRWKIRAESRRKLFPRLRELAFDEISRGMPEPLEGRPESEAAGGLLSGVPVSSGRARGRARVINSLDDAALLVSGEVMIAAYTDVGWTPYFSLAAALVTEIGSTLSHGAVVAREYGIPAVVGVKGACMAIATGDVIEVDGEKGIISIVERAGPLS
ncbi:MAG TPA: PEP/pyruvate-binding domain-containing protein [Spirochaetota bacterium]|nr:PEP/pyruvate-binding domain-containing protein [Spirochaetota bacterium]